MKIPQDIFDQAKKDLEHLRTEGQQFANKMRRLKIDLESFKSDLEFLASEQHRIIYACDYIELRAYQKPEDQLNHYLYDIEDHENLAPRGPLYKEKVVKRWYRLKELFFNDTRQTLVLPYHMEELERDILYLGQIVDRESIKLSDIINEMQNSHILQKEINKVKDIISSLGDPVKQVTEADAIFVTKFFKVFAPAIAARSFNPKIEANTRLERIAALLKKGNIEGIGAFDWGKAGFNDDTIVKINAIDINILPDKVAQVAELIKSASGVREDRTIAFDIDARALCHIHEINNILSSTGSNIQLQFVSSSLNLFRVCNAIHKDYLSVNIRHPKLLAGCLYAREEIWQRVEADYTNILSALDIFLESFKDLSSDKLDKDTIRKLRREISGTWQHLESIIFTKEVKEKPVITDDIISVKQNKIFDNILQFLKSEKDGFDKYIHQTFRIVFDELIDIYLLKMPFKDMPLNDYTALYFNNRYDHSLIPFRLRLVSPSLRYIFEFHDRQVVSYITSQASQKMKFGEIVKKIISDQANGINLKEFYETKLIRALLMATLGKWEIVLAICANAIAFEKNKNRIHEAYVLQNFAYRYLAFDKMGLSENESVDLYQKALECIENAKKIKKDHRYTLVTAAMELEYACYPGLIPSRKNDHSTIANQIDICETVMVEFSTDDKQSNFNKYMKKRSLQILLSYYLADVANIMKLPGRTRIDKNRAIEWYNKFLELDLDENNTNDESELYRGMKVIQFSCGLLFEFNDLNERKCIDRFDQICTHCRNMTTKGFFKKFTHELKKYLLKDKILKKYPKLESFAKKKWPKVYEDN